MKKYIFTLMVSLAFCLFSGMPQAWALSAAFDFGDAPDIYGTTITNDGARHMIKNFYLGSGIDGEIDGQPSASAANDDRLYGGGNDNGIFFTTPLVAGRSETINATVQYFNNATSTGYLNAWIDFNDDGDWGDAGEQILSAEELDSGTHQLSFDVPIDAALGFTFARFRLSSNENLNFSGAAIDGEVEDYRVKITGSSVPVPSSMLLLGTGLLGLFGIRRSENQTDCMN